MEAKEVVVIYLLRQDFKEFTTLLEGSSTKVRYLAIVSGVVAIHLFKSDLENVIATLKHSQLNINYLIDKSDKTAEQINLGINWFI